MILGLRTVIYNVTDLGKAREWYSQVLGTKPYLDQPYYMGFNVGGFELGIVPDGTGEGIGGVTAYWGVADAESTYIRLLSLGAIAHSEVKEVGGGIKVATVTDPFGNLFGIIENPDFSIKNAR